MGCNVKKLWKKEQSISVNDFNCIFIRAHLRFILTLSNYLTVYKIHTN